MDASAEAARRFEASMLGAHAFDEAGFDAVRAEWLAIARLPRLDFERFGQVKREADALAKAGAWDSGPSDVLTVLGRHRDELTHSRLLAWLLVPNHRHGLGRAVVTGLLDAIWPGEDLMSSGPVTVDLEVPGAGVDELGRLCEARADVVLRGDGLTVVIENKLDAGEQPDQCERLYWAFVDDAVDTRWVFLTPSGRNPGTTRSEPARTAWRAVGYRKVREVVESSLASARESTATGRLTAIQYLETLARSVARD
ncbi:MAG: PD-(D/E)XK nuclease family protein [Chloroflexota bacterium]